MEASSADDVGVSYQVSHNFGDRKTNVKLSANTRGTTVNAEVDDRALTEVSAVRDLDVGDRSVNTEASWLVKPKLLPVTRIYTHTLFRTLTLTLHPHPHPHLGELARQCPDGTRQAHVQPWWLERSRQGAGGCKSVARDSVARLPSYIGIHGQTANSALWIAPTD